MGRILKLSLVILTSDNIVQYDGVTLNPTAYDSKVSILVETAEQAKKPLPTNAFNNWPKVEVKAGETQTVTIARNGQLKANQ